MQDVDRAAFAEKLEELDQKIRDLAAGDLASASTFSKDRHQIEQYNLSRRSLRLWPVSISPLVGEEHSDQFLRLRAAVYLFVADFLKVKDPEELEVRIL